MMLASISADVANYVQEGSALDREAEKQGDERVPWQTG